MIRTTNEVYDGWVTLKGVDGSRRPLEVSRQMVHRAVNAVFRGDQVGPRPAWVYRLLGLPTGVYPATGDSILTRDFHEGRFQGTMVYTPDNGDPYILSMHGGRLFKIDVLNNYTVTDVSIRGQVLTTAPFTAPAQGDTATITVSSTAQFTAGMTFVVRVDTAVYRVTVVLSGTQMTIENVTDTEGTVYPVGTRVEYADVNPGRFWRVWMIQAEKWALIQDGESRCLIWDGAAARRAEANEIPTGTAMAYGLGRVWMSFPDGKRFGAGDLIYGASGTPAEVYRDAILGWTENLYLAGGGAFRVPEQAGEIRGMAFTSNLDTSLGQGALQVFTTNGSFSVNALIDRAAWNADYDADSSPIQTVSLKYGGTHSDRTLTTINSDFFFRSGNGIRTFQLGRRDMGRWSNTPISKQVNWALEGDAVALLQYGSAVFHDDRYLCTVRPQLTERGVIHKGLVSLDMQQVTWLDNEPPQWDGLWTFGYIYQVLHGTFRGKERCFAFTQNHEGEVELYEYDATKTADQTAATEPTRIRWVVEFGSIAFPMAEGSLGTFDLKTLKGSELNITDLQGEAWFRLRWRPDGYPCWVVWGTFEECAEMGACGYEIDEEGCKDWAMGQKQFRGLVSLPMPAVAVDAATNLKLNNFYAVQIRLDVRGYCKIGGLRLVAGILDQPIVGPRANLV